MNQQSFEDCLRKGFLDFHIIPNDEHFVPLLVTNNPAKEEKVLDKVLSQLSLCSSFFFSVAFITKSGIACLKDAFLELQKRNISGKILTSQYLNFTEPDSLRELLKFKNIELRVMPDNHAFHAKGYGFAMPKTVDNVESCTMIVGSSNLTGSALTSNEEWNLFLTSARDGDLVRQVKGEFDSLWHVAIPVTESWIQSYEEVYKKNYQERRNYRPQGEIKPNLMQTEALKGIQEIRDKHEDRALLISATGTGKTYLSAFDVERFKPGRFLFLVHRELIASTSKDSFERVFCNSDDTGLLSGNSKDTNKKYLFSTVQTMSRDEVMTSFDPKAFDYIVVDEVHRAGAPTYKKLFAYFKPKFWLGMTATPERTDGNDIFDLFNHNIAYEIRLQKALEENLLVPFHYHGISEIEVDGKILDDHSEFRDLTSEERVKHILNYANLYGSDGERVKGLVFCSRGEEAKQLAEMFCAHGKKAIALGGYSNESEREEAIKRLEEDGFGPNHLDYIFTVDIFNEGVDIPKVNQIIMLRPTQSAIVFVQQLGRGLRQAPNKRYIEVLDFIGNYENNFLLPIALYGDRTYNKDNVRRLLTKNVLPGASTVHFDDVTKERIFASIDKKGQLADYKELQESYKNMQFRLGRQPMMMDFVYQGDKDPYLFVAKKKSYYEFVLSISKPETTLPEPYIKVLEMVSLELAQGKRVEELIVLLQLLKKDTLSSAELTQIIKKEYGYDVSEATINGVANVLSLAFFSDAIRNGYQIPLIIFNNDVFSLSKELKQLLNNAEFKNYLIDTLEYSMYSFEKMYKGHENDFVQGFVRYAKYSRKDVCRILNLTGGDSSTLYGYQIKGNYCPIFVTYKKSKEITSSTMYNDQFVTQQQFSWMTRSRVHLHSSQVEQIYSNSIRKLLFIQKNDKQKDFYYMGDVLPMHEPVETTMKDDKGKVLPVVNFQFRLDKPVEDKLYAYIITKTSEDDQIEK
jgi:superfamily II DNA or RNA helicase/HKD family nuclease